MCSLSTLYRYLVQTIRHGKRRGLVYPELAEGMLAADKMDQLVGRGIGMATAPFNLAE